VLAASQFSFAGGNQLKAEAIVSFANRGSEATGFNCIVSLGHDDLWLYGRSLVHQSLVLGGAIPRIIR
jgi:hypothetical protein